MTVEKFRIVEQPRNKNYLLKTHHQLAIGKIPNVTYFCQSANVPGMSITDIDQATIFNPIKRPGGNIIQDKLSIIFLADENMKAVKEIQGWIRECSNYKDFKEYRNPTVHLYSDACLFLMSSNNNPLFRVTFQNLFPISVSGLIFDSSRSESEPFLCSAEFAFTTFEIENI